MTVVNALVEGVLDEAAAIRIIEASGHVVGTIYGKKGCGYIRKNISSFNKAAQGAHYLALLDLMDTRISCPPQVVVQWLPNRSPGMLFRIVVRELESWLLADRSNLSKFLSVHLSKLPHNPEKVPDPKLTIVNLARKSRIKRIREGLVPEPNSTAQVGKLYVSEMRLFITKYWDLKMSRTNAPSLDACLRSLEALCRS